MASRVVAVVEHPAAENPELPRRRRAGTPEGQEHIEF
jgi:hypothetical protein